MRLLKLLLVVVMIVAVSGCSCWKKKIGMADNIPVAAEGEVIADIHFDYDRYAIRADAQRILAQGAEWLKSNPAANVKIEGHCDARGTAEYNMVLGQHRAQAAMDYLRSLGVETSRMSTISYGKELPLDPAHNEAAYAKNRRAHLAVSQ